MAQVFRHSWLERGGYFDESEMDIQIAQSFSERDGKPVLTANIPVKALRKVAR